MCLLDFFASNSKLLHKFVRVYHRIFSTFYHVVFSTLSPEMFTILRLSFSLSSNFPHFHENRCSLTWCAKYAREKRKTRKHRTDAPKTSRNEGNSSVRWYRRCESSESSVLYKCAEQTTVSRSNRIKIHPHTTRRKEHTHTYFHLYTTQTLTNIHNTCSSGLERHNSWKKISPF